MTEDPGATRHASLVHVSDGGSVLLADVAVLELASSNLHSMFSESKRLERWGCKGVTHNDKALALVNKLARSRDPGNEVMV